MKEFNEQICGLRGKRVRLFLECGTVIDGTFYPCLTNEIQPDDVFSMAMAGNGDGIGRVQGNFIGKMSQIAGVLEILEAYHH